jgi:ABC-type proline/glycine betaine transport system permease subunit
MRGPTERVQKVAWVLRHYRWPVSVVFGLVYAFAPGFGRHANVAQGLLLLFTVAVFMWAPAMETLWRRFAEGFNDSPPEPSQAELPQ